MKETETYKCNSNLLQILIYCLKYSVVDANCQIRAMRVIRHLTQHASRSFKDPIAFCMAERNHP
jgi:hypothetical protein